MRKQHTAVRYQLTCFFLFCVVLYLACKKSEQTVPATPIPVTKNFFESPKNIDPVVSGIINALNRENEKFPFAEAMVKNAGYPQWEYAVKKSRASSRGDAQEQDINIPLVRDGEMKTTAILAVAINNADTAYELFYPQYYTRYAMGDDTTVSNQRKAKDFFGVFAGFDYALFGITQYRVNDGSIFGFSKNDRLNVTVSYPDKATGRCPAGSPNLAAADYINVCKVITACVYASTRVANSKVLVNCVTTTQCVGVWIGMTSGGGGSTTPIPTAPTGGGTSGTTSSGGGGGTSSLTVTPCAKTMSSNGRELVGTNPCNTPWTPIIRNSVVDPCLKKMVDAAISRDCQNQITSFIQRAFSYSVDINLTFNDKPLGTDDGITQYTNTPDYSVINVSITLNSNPLSLPHASKEYVAVTILHEAIHAWIDMDTKRPVSNNISHEQMASTAKIKLLADALTEMYPTISVQDATDLAWGGLQFTNAWTALAQTDKDRIIQTNSDYKILAKGIPCN